MRRTITGFSNPTVKLPPLAARQEAPRGARGQFLAEGLRLLTDARESGHLPEMLVMAHRRAIRIRCSPRSRPRSSAAGGEVVETSAEILAKITGKDNPQAVRGGVLPSSTPRWPLLDRTARRRSGWWRRRCAIRATSARCCAPATRSARAG